MDNPRCGAETDAVQPLDLKPLRSLAPMFPTPMGYDVATQSADPPLVYVTPFRSCSSSSELPRPAPTSVAQPVLHSPIPRNATPISVAFPAPPHEDEPPSEEDCKPFREQERTTLPKTLPILTTTGTKRTRQAHDSNAATVKQRSIRWSFNKELTIWPFSSDNPRESVEAMMIVFDSLRRRTVQLDEKEDANRRADLKAGALMMQNNLRINNLKTVGHVPGVEVGDIFFFRIEMCIVGLHAPAMAGIDYMPVRHVGKDDALAVCIVSSGGYENDEGDTDILVYTGQGGNSKHKEKHDQKLERGNLALVNSTNKRNQIRVVRSAQDPFCPSGKIYVYDGLYRIQDSWMDKANNGFNVFKYKLRREPGQPDGISVCKMTEKWTADPATRENVILPDISSSIEKLPVCLVNDFDSEKGPSHFSYVTGLKYLIPLSKKKPSQNCKCVSACMPGGANCSCAEQNGGDLPYSSSGLLVKHTPMLYECSSNCQCSANCRNRVTQKGIRLKFEVFWTGNRGWGLRSWNPIRAGTFICEYAGEVDDETKLNMGVQEDDYVFHPSCLNDKVLRWNLGAALLEETTAAITTETFKPLPIVISAKYSGNVARFLNHSCSPNLLWQAVQYDHGDDHYPHIMFFAMKHIPPMTELTYDYGIRGAPPGFKRKFAQGCNLKQCLCGSKNCQGSFC